MESSKETGCQAPEGSKLCINNCGFFGSATTQNMCSKCHKDMQLKQQQVKLAASSIENIVTGGSSSNEKATVLADATCVQAAPIELKEAPKQSSSELVNAEKKGPSRCAACSKRVGLIGFKCKCGDLFCSSHRYAEKHACTFDYKTGGREAIAKANPIVKAEKLEKI